MSETERRDSQVPGVTQQPHSASERHDSTPKPQSAQAERHDALPAITWAPLDGWGDPLAVTCRHPDIVTFWVSDSDLGRFSWYPWIPVLAGKTNYITLGFNDPAQKVGEPVRYKELHLMQMHRRHAEELRARDPKMRQHGELKAALIARAEASEAAGQKGFARQYSMDVTI